MKDSLWLRPGRRKQDERSLPFGVKLRPSFQLALKEFAAQHKVSQAVVLLSLATQNGDQADRARAQLKKLWSDHSEK
jgi:hypothetical protein